MSEVLRYRTKDRRNSFAQTILRPHVIAPLALGLAIGGYALFDRVIDEGNNRFVKSPWQQEMKDKLQGRKPLQQTERLYPRVRVVASGRDIPDRSQMERKQTPVNVRSYPATNYPTLTGKQTEIIGEIEQGEEVFNVILTDSPTASLTEKEQWGAFFCASEKGSIKKDNKEIPALDTGEVCVIHADYLEALK